MSLVHLRTVPVLRSFDESKAREFYVDFLGFAVDWEHRFDSNAPLFMQMSRGGIVLQISEHHGDGTPGSLVRIEIEGLRAFHAELIAKHYKNNRPGIEKAPWGEFMMTVSDPASNRITFVEPITSDSPT